MCTPFLEVSVAQDSADTFAFQDSLTAFINRPADFERWLLNDEAAGDEFAEVRKEFKKASKANWDTYAVTLEERKRLFRINGEQAKALFTENSKGYNTAMNDLRRELVDQVSKSLDQGDLQYLRKRWLALSFRKSGTRIFELPDAWTALGVEAPVPIEEIQSINQEYWSKFESEVEKQILKVQNSIYRENFDGFTLQQMLKSFDDSGR